MQAFEPLTIPLYRRLWATSVVFGVGHTLQVVAGNWLMLELTGNPLWVALMVASPHLPLLLLAIPSGAMSDIVDRRRVLMLSATLMATSAVGMATLHHLEALTAGRLLALGIVLGVGIAFYVPAWQATVPNLVPRELVPRAVSLNSASGAVAMAVGPGLGGTLLARFGFGVPATVAAGGYVVLLLSVLGVRGVRWRDDAGAGMVTAMATGLRYVRFSAGYRWLLLVTAGFGASSAALRALLPSVTSDRLGSGAGTYGALLAAMGAGALAGALLREQAQAWLGRRLVPVAIATYGGAGIVVGLSTTIATTALVMVLAGVAWTWTLATLNSVMQELAPAWVRGRAMSVYVLALFGLVPIGTVVAGWLGEVLGADGALVISSGAVLALAVVAMRRPIVDPADLPAPDPVGTRPDVGHPTVRSDERVMVATVWTVDRERLVDFAAAMEAMRRVRMRTGAFRWTLYRDVVDPLKFTEVFEVHTWEQHLQQHERLDATAIETIQHAVSFDVGEGPRSVHLVGVDALGITAEGWTSADLAEHDQLHQRDGSITVGDDPAIPRTRG